MIERMPPRRLVLASALGHVDGFTLPCAERNLMERQAAIDQIPRLIPAECRLPE
jgi:hypothetical protein